MTNTFSLQPLVNLAKIKNESAAKKLGALNRNQQSAQSKLELLLQYRKDYQDKMHQAQLNGMGLEDLRNFQDFIYRLDDAITQQTAVVTQAQVSVESGRCELTGTQRRMKSFDTLAQRHTASVNTLQSKLEQKLNDEHTGRISAFKNSGNYASDNDD